MQTHEPLLPLSDSQKEELEEATSRYARSVSRAAVGWLRARGIDKDIAQRFRLGVADEPMPGHMHARGWLAIPYLDLHQTPLSIRFRRPDWADTSGPKYLSLEGERSRVFNVAAIRDAADTICVTEGEFDTMVLTKLGYHSVAIPGANGWQSHHRRLLADFQKVLVFGDSDEAGASFARKVTQSLRSARSVHLPEGLDVTDLHLEDNDHLVELIERNA